MIGTIAVGAGSSHGSILSKPHRKFPEKKQKQQEQRRCFITGSEPLFPAMVTPVGL